jgi:hypothetical protein
MNEIVHFLTGYLVARALKYKENRFESFFVAICALIIDIDSTFNLFFPFEHGVITHTMLGGFLLILAFSAITYPVAAPLLRKTGTSFKKLLLIGWLGMLSHLALDAFTYYESAADATHHVFFWPFWNFSVHINTVLPFAWVTYDLRVWIEVIYTAIVAVILLVQLFYKKQNFFTVFLPSKWMSHSPSNGTTLHENLEQIKIYVPYVLIAWEVLTLFIFSLQYYAGYIFALIVR